MDPDHRAQPASASITITDSDGIVAAGGNDLSITVAAKNPVATATLVWVRVSGVLDGPAVENTAGDQTLGIVIPDGTPEGEYTISARFHYPDDTGETDDENVIGDQASERLDAASATFTVGDTGTNLAAAALTLGNSADDEPLTTADETVAETGTVPASDGDVWLKVSATNSLGNAATTAASIRSP